MWVYLVEIASRGDVGESQAYGTLSLKLHWAAETKTHRWVFTTSVLSEIQPADVKLDKCY